MNTSILPHLSHWAIDIFPVPWFQMASATQYTCNIVIDNQMRVAPSMARWNDLAQFVGSSKHIKTWWSNSEQFYAVFNYLMPFIVCPNSFLVAVSGDWPFLATIATVDHRMVLSDFAQFWRLKTTTGSVYICSYTSVTCTTEKNSKLSAIGGGGLIFKLHCAYLKISPLSSLDHVCCSLIPRLHPQGGKRVWGLASIFLVWLALDARLKPKPQIWLVNTVHGQFKLVSATEALIHSCSQGSYDYAKAAIWLVYLKTRLLTVQNQEYAC